MNEKDHECWDRNRHRFEKMDFIGAKLVGRNGMRVIPSFKRLWLEHVYIATDGEYAVEYHQKSEEFFSNIPKSSG
jgi:hypothetical protein